MSNTRHAENEGAFRQEKYSSSPGFDRGLMGNLVARRVGTVTDASERQLIWWLQAMSHREGGLEKLAAEMIEKFSDQFSTAAMRKHGIKTGQIYSTEKVLEARDQMGEISPNSSTYIPGRISFPLRCDEHFGEEGKGSPTSYPAEAFVKYCKTAAGNFLSRLLTEYCLNPEAVLEAWFCPPLAQIVAECMAASIAEIKRGRVVTEIGTAVCETLDYCLKTGCTVLIDGLARTGKTFAVKTWCELHPGQARYVQIPSCNDDIGFFRSIAKSLGVSINQNSKAQQLRDRIEDTLQHGKLALILDEAHYAWPQSNYREALPSRINWIMTALVNQGVPVAFITTPQFMLTQKDVERRTSWTSEQFIGRIGHYEKLPDCLSKTDLAAVAKAFLPQGCAKSIEALQVYASTSAKYLAAIEHAARRAFFIAEKAGRHHPTFTDVAQALKSCAIPSDTSMVKALARTKDKGRARAIAAPGAEPISRNDRGSQPAQAMPGRNMTPTELLTVV